MKSAKILSLATRKRFSCARRAIVWSAWVLVRDQYPFPAVSSVLEPVWECWSVRATMKSPTAIDTAAETGKTEDDRRDRRHR